MANLLLHSRKEQTRYSHILKAYDEYVATLKEEDQELGESGRADWNMSFSQMTTATIPRFMKWLYDTGKFKDMK